MSKRRIEYLHGQLERPGLIWLGVLIAVVLTLPSLAGGFAIDDHLHRIAVVRHPHVPATPVSPFNLFDFTMGATWVAALAMILYAVDDAHGMTVGWIANRNALIACVFGMLSLLMHDRWRREQWRPGAWLGVISLAVALLAGEFAIGVGAYLLAHALFLEKNPWRKKILGLVPYVVVVLSWRLVCTMLGYGVRGTDLYVEPLHEPSTFLTAMAGRLPVYLLGQFGLPPADLWLIVSDGGRMLLTGLGVLAVGVIIVLVAPLWRRSAEARFFGLGALLAVVPMCATYPFDRHLLFVGVGGMGLVALFLSFVGGAVDDAASGSRHVPARVLAGAWIVIHVVLAPVALPVRVLEPRRMDEHTERASHSLPADPTLASQHLVVVNAPEIMSGFYVMVRRVSLGERLPAFVRFLSVSDDSIRIERKDAQTLRFRWSDGHLARPLDRFFRGLRHPFAVGDAFHLTGFRARVVRVTTDGRPAEVEYQFATPLEDASLRWVTWAGKGYAPFDPPAEGETVVLPPIDLIEHFSF